MDKQLFPIRGLPQRPPKKTIYIGKQQDVQLLLVAENLGSLPPNTGLLVIRDGDNNYQLNFSADLQTNAAVTIRKKKE